MSREQLLELEDVKRSLLAEVKEITTRIQMSAEA